MSIPITKPQMGEAEANAILEPIHSGWLVQGPKVAAFEEKVQRFTSLPHAVATSSCTTALHLALLACGIGPGDEVIVPAFTYIATANAVEYCGATPVFADIELDSFNLSPTALERAITAKTKAVVPVHLFGLMADMRAILPIAKAHDLAIVEDAACAIGATLDGIHAGGFGAVGALSFHPRKIITTGEGGMLLTDNPDIAAHTRRLRDHGAAMSDRARHERGGFLLPDFDELGYNYRMTDLQGALGVVQMDRLPAILEKRRALAARFDDAFAPLARLATPTVPQGFAHSYQAYVTLYGGAQSPDLSRLEGLHAERNAFMTRLADRGISTRPGTHAVHLLGYYRNKYGLLPEQFPNALIADKLSVALPLYPDMSADDFNQVVAAVSEEV